MLNVFVCEDNPSHMKRISKCVQDTIMIENLDMELAMSTDNPNEIIEYIKENKSTGLYFLDVDLGECMDGITLAAKIREYDPRGFIAFITTHAETLRLTFERKVEAMDFIVKDDFSSVKRRIYECVVYAQEKYAAKAPEQSGVFTVKTSDMVYAVEYDKILYFETSGTIHKVTLHAVDKTIEFYAKLNDIEKSIDPSLFFRCHKSIIVNLNKISSVDKANKLVRLAGGASCDVSFRQLPKLIDLLSDKAKRP